jgi:hypothetical protein
VNYPTLAHGTSCECTSSFGVGRHVFRFSYASCSALANYKCYRDLSAFNPSTEDGDFPPKELNAEKKTEKNVPFQLNFFRNKRLLHFEPAKTDKLLFEEAFQQAWLASPFSRGLHSQCRQCSPMFFQMVDADSLQTPS